jgi:hypothetical protein
MSPGIGSGREPPRILVVVEQNEYETLLVQERAWLTRLWSPVMWSLTKLRNRRSLLPMQPHIG